jgi:hypothetical protein
MKLTQKKLRKLIENVINEAPIPGKPMTVADLITFLQSQDPSARVVVDSSSESRSLSMNDFRSGDYFDDADTGEEVEGPVLHIATWD